MWASSEQGGTAVGDQRVTRAPRHCLTCVASQIVLKLIKWSLTSAGPNFCIIVFSSSFPAATENRSAQPRNTAICLRLQQVEKQQQGAYKPAPNRNHAAKPRPQIESGHFSMHACCVQKTTCERPGRYLTYYLGLLLSLFQRTRSDKTRTG
jgi:hypothetical protein